MSTLPTGYVFNVLHKKHLSVTEAGVLSRAKKATYNSETWSIVKLNYTMFLHMRETWKDLPNHPQCPVALKDELLNKTSP